jgi:hypothetical protein
MRRSSYDDAWAEAVIQRYYRRRDLPRRQLKAAFLAALDDLFGPLVRWLNRRLGGGGD